MSILTALKQAEATIRERDAEIARLRADARSYANVMLSEENDRLIAEIERLRAALKQYADLDVFNDGGALARRALEQKDNR